MCDAALESTALGFFDGVHRGHQAILARADRVLTFRNHPLEVLAPERAPRLIMSCDERLAAIRACGVREIELLSFTPELAALSAVDFAARYLTGRRIRCGANANFGRGGEGTVAWLEAHGYEVEVVPFAVCRGEAVSSSRIRSALCAGEIAAANEMLGHPFRLTGWIEKGKGLGRRLGFPTVNLHVRPDRVELPYGVYSVEIGGCRGLANYGVAPTLGPNAWRDPVLEVHFPDGIPAEFDFVEPQKSEIAVCMMDFLRPERRFRSVEDLQAQISADCKAWMRLKCGR